MMKFLAVFLVSVLSSEVRAEEEAVEVFSLSQWVEENGGWDAVDAMIAEEAAAAAQEGFFENPAASEEAAEAANQAMEDCGVQIGSFAPSMGGLSDSIKKADAAVAISMPLDDLFNFDFSNATVAAGAHGYGMSTNAARLWADPEAAAECVEKKVDELVDKIIEEKNKLENGDYSTVKNALSAAVVKMAIDKAYEYDSELGEALDTLSKLATHDDTCG